MKIKHLVWLISLLMIASLSLVSCKDDDEPQKEEQKNEENKEEGKNPTEELKEELPTDPNTAVVKILVLNEDNIPQRTTVYMSDKSNAELASEALTYEETDENGIAKFIINAEDLNGNYKKTFRFYCVRDKTFECAKTEVILKAGEGKTDTIVKPARLAFDKSDFDTPIVKVDRDLTITISTQLHFNLKIKSLVVVDPSGNIAYDFMKENQELATKSNKMSDSRRIIDIIEDSVKLSTNNLPFNNYTVLVETINNKQKEVFHFHPISDGTGHLPTKGVGRVNPNGGLDSYSDYYISHYPSQFEIISSEDGNMVVGLRKSSLSTSESIANKVQKILMYQDGVLVDEIHENGFIITDNYIFQITKIEKSNNSSYSDISYSFWTNWTNLYVDISSQYKHVLDLSAFEADLQ